MKVINDLLDYNSMKIVQVDEYFNFSLDSVLLPNFVTLRTKVKKILDLGTGNAPIPLILSTLCNAHIYGIEIQKEVFELAKESVEMNNLQDRVTLINDDMKNLDKYFEQGSFDVIVSNPPYFEVEEESKFNDNEIKTIARHEKKIKLKDIIEIARKYLDNGGVFAMVHRTERLIEIIQLMKENNIEPKRIRFIYPKEGTESNMVLIEGRKNVNPGLKVVEPLIAHTNQDEYSKEVKEMFKARDKK